MAWCVGAGSSGELQSQAGGLGGILTPKADMIFLSKLPKGQALFDVFQAL